MKVLVNPEENRIEIGFEGWTYMMAPKSKVMVDEKVGEFLVESYPWLKLEIPPKTKGPNPIKQIDRKKTLPMGMKPGAAADLQVSRANERNATLNIDGLPDSGSVDGDGISWIGEGIEVDDDLTNKGVFH